MTIKPTTAYVGDNTDGKLTLYVPYYGVTGIGQITLSASASGNVQIKNMQILPKKADETSATVTFQLDEGASAPFSNGEEQECEPLPVLVYDNYTITGRDNGFETAANFQGTPVSNSWLGKGTCKYNPTTKTYTQTIDIAINTDTENSRAGAVVVFSPSGRELARFIVEQAACEATNPDKPVINDITINKLVPSGANSANCYIITAPGRYELPAYMGAYSNSELADNLLCKGTPDIVWNDNESNNKIEFYQGHLSQNKIIIDINPTKENGVVTGHGSSISPGNAVISINDANGVQWSWHLWFCTSVPDTQKYAEEVYLMDRYLGATKTATDGISLVSSYISLYWKDGLYYQSGRKDPFKVYESVENKETKYSYEHTAVPIASDANITQHPTHFYTDWSSKTGWTATKGQHDPCPPGYKIPTIDVWSKSKGDFTRADANDYLFLYDIAWENAIVYTYNGLLDSSGEYQTGRAGLGSETRTYKRRTDLVGITNKKEISVPSYQPDAYVAAIIVDTKKYPKPKKFENIVYEIFDKTVEGNMLASNNSQLTFGYKDKGINIISYDVTEGSWSSTFVGTKYVNYKNAKTKSVSGDQLTETEREEILGFINTSDLAVDNLLNTEWGDVKDFFTGTPSKVIFQKPSNSGAEGNLIRCLAETPPAGN